MRVRIWFKNGELVMYDDISMFKRYKGYVKFETKTTEYTIQEMNIKTIEIGDLSQTFAMNFDK